MMARPALRNPWIAVGLTCAIAFVVLAVLVSRSGGFAFDEAVISALQGLPVPVRVWEICTELGGIILLPIGIAFVLAALVTGRLRLALIVAVVLTASAFFTDLVKDYVARPRPPGEALVAASGYSFPSGHTLSSTATYGLLALVAWRSRLALAVRRIAVVAGVTLPVLVGLSRIALGVHYPTDVVGGWLAGTMFVALAATLIGVTGAMARDWRQPRPGPAAHQVDAPSEMTVEDPD
jgi:undecaprenyl-diphosphatase